MAGVDVKGRIHVLNGLPFANASTILLLIIWVCAKTMCMVIVLFDPTNFVDYRDDE